MLYIETNKKSRNKKEHIISGESHIGNFMCVMTYLLLILIIINNKGIENASYCS